MTQPPFQPPPPPPAPPGRGGVRPWVVAVTGLLALVVGAVGALLIGPALSGDDDEEPPGTVEVMCDALAQIDPAFRASLEAGDPVLDLEEPHIHLVVAISSLAQAAAAGGEANERVGEAGLEVQTGFARLMPEEVARNLTVLDHHCEAAAAQ